MYESSNRECSAAQIKKALDLKRQQKLLDKRLKLKGTVMKNSLVGLL
jgi:hypothetical protein